MTQHQEVYNEDCALYVPCSQVQLARVVVRALVLVDVVCVMLVVLIAHVDVVRAVDTVFVAIFCSGRCTLYTTRALLTSTKCKNCCRIGHWAKDCWRPSGRANDNSTCNNSNTQKGKGHKRGTRKGKHVDVVGTNQPSKTASTTASTESSPSQTPKHLENSRVLQTWNR